MLYDESFLHASSSDDKFRKVAPDIQIWVSKNEVYSAAKATVAAISRHHIQISILNMSIDQGKEEKEDVQEKREWKVCEQP